MRVGSCSASFAQVSEKSDEKTVPYCICKSSNLPYWCRMNKNFIQHSSDPSLQINLSMTLIKIPAFKYHIQNQTVSIISLLRCRYYQYPTLIYGCPDRVFDPIFISVLFLILALYHFQCTFSYNSIKIINVVQICLTNEELFIKKIHYSLPLSFPLRLSVIFCMMSNNTISIDGGRYSGYVVAGRTGRDLDRLFKLSTNNY